MQELVDNGTIKITDDNSSSNNHCPTSQETRLNPIDDQEKLATRTFSRLKYDKNVVCLFIEINHNSKHKEGNEHFLFHRNYSLFLGKCKAFKTFVQE